jgi:hypothetical protein
MTLADTSACIAVLTPAGADAAVTTPDMNSFLIATSQRSIPQTRQFRLASYRARLPRPQAKSSAMPAFGNDGSAKCP